MNITQKFFIISLYVFNIYGSQIHLPLNFFTISDHHAMHSIPSEKLLTKKVFILVFDEYHSILKTENIFKEIELFCSDLFSSQKKDDHIFVIYNWVDTGLNYKKIANSFASSMNLLFHQFKAADFTIVAHNQGCNIANIASQNFSHSIETMIQLAPPVFPKKENYPNTKTIKELFVFFSNSSHSIPKKTLHPKYERLYQLVENLNPFNVLLVCNNNHHLEVENFVNRDKNAGLSKKLLNLIQLIRNHNDHHIAINLTNLQLKKSLDQKIIKLDKNRKRTLNKVPNHYIKKHRRMRHKAQHSVLMKMLNKN